MTVGAVTAPTAVAAVSAVPPAASPADSGDAGGFAAVMANVARQDGNGPQGGAGDAQDPSEHTAATDTAAQASGPGADAAQAAAASALTPPPAALPVMGDALAGMAWLMAQHLPPAQAVAAPAAAETPDTAVASLAGDAAGPAGAKTGGTGTNKYADTAADGLAAPVTPWPGAAVPAATPGAAAPGTTLGLVQHMAASTADAAAPAAGVATARAAASRGIASVGGGAAPDLGPAVNSANAAPPAPVQTASFAAALTAAATDRDAAVTASSPAGVPDMSTLAGLAGLGSASGVAGTAPAGAPAAVYQAAMTAQPGEPGFVGDLASQVQFLVDGGLQQAELRLNPPELGPIQIQLNLSLKDQVQTADISFAAVHSFTRDSLEQALPALRDMLQSQGLNLGQAGVSDGRAQAGQDRGAAPQPPDGPQRRGDPAGTAGAAGDPPPRAARVTHSLLDLYA